jgi:hypothetical protein
MWVPQKGASKNRRGHLGAGLDKPKFDGRFLKTSRKISSWGRRQAMADCGAALIITIFLPLVAFLSFRGREDSSTLKFKDGCFKMAAGSKVLSTKGQNFGNFRGG